MESKHLCVIVSIALVMLGTIECVALYLGVDGAVLGSVVAVFGVIVGAVAKTIYDVKKE